jgi:Fe2+ transport system protein B
MAKLNKLSLLLTFLLLNGVITGCNSCKSEKEKLEQEERRLMQKIQQQVKPDHWEKIKENIQQTKGNKKEIEDSITYLESILEIIAKKKKNKSITNQEDNLLVDTINGLSAGSNDNNKNLELAENFLTNSLALAQNLKKQADLKK